MIGRDLCRSCLLLLIFTCEKPPIYQTYPSCQYKRSQCPTADWWIDLWRIWWNHTLCVRVGKIALNCRKYFQQVHRSDDRRMVLSSSIDVNDTCQVPTSQSWACYVLKFVLAYPTINMWFPPHSPSERTICAAKDLGVIRILYILTIDPLSTWKIPNSEPHPTTSCNFNNSKDL